jgi:hypothetical protein
MSRAAFAVALGVTVVLHTGLARAQKPPEKIDPVAIAGCLKEGAGGTWMLVNASDPVPSTANAPTSKELAALDTPGRNEFQLIGVSIFNLPAHRNHWVIVKGLPIKATPVTRLNVTSMTMKAESCPPPPPAKIG